MLIHQAFRYELDPTREQVVAFLRHCGLSRFVRNWALARYDAWWDANKDLPREERDTASRPTPMKLSREWTSRKAEIAPWSDELARTTVTYALNAVGDAWKGYFRRKAQGFSEDKAGRPRYKGKKSPRRYTVQDQNPTVFPHKIKIPRVGLVRTKEPTTKLEGEIMRICISRVADRWYCTLMVKRFRHVDAVQGMTVGVDLGINSCVTLAGEGDLVERFPPNTSLERALGKLRKRSREHSKKQLGSRNREKARVKRARVEARVARIRADHLHKITTYLAKTYGRIVVEGYHIRDLMEHEVEVSSRRREFADRGLGELRRQLEYKGKWYGCEVIVAPMHAPTNRTCSACGHVTEKKLKSPMFRCGACGFEIERQVNTARALVAVYGSDPPGATPGQGESEACGARGPDEASASPESSEASTSSSSAMKQESHGRKREGRPGSASPAGSSIFSRRSPKSTQDGAPAT